MSRFLHLQLAIPGGETLCHQWEGGRRYASLEKFHERTLPAAFCIVVRLFMHDNRFL